MTKIDNSNADADADADADDDADADADADDDVDHSLDDAASSELSCRLKMSWEDERPTTSRNSPAA